MAAEQSLADTGTIRIVKQTSDSRVYMNVTWRFPYKYGGAGVYFGKGADSMRLHVRPQVRGHGNMRLGHRYKRCEIV